MFCVWQGMKIAEFAKALADRGSNAKVLTVDSYLGNRSGTMIARHE
jgi:hypothetical protein